MHLRVPPPIQVGMSSWFILALEIFSICLFFLKISGEPRYYLYVGGMQSFSCTLIFRYQGLVDTIALIALLLIGMLTFSSRKGDSFAHLETTTKNVCGS